MIKLIKPIRRETLGLAATKKGRIVSREAEGARPIFVSLLPGDDLEFHIKGTKQRFTIPLAVVIQYAQTRAILDEYNRKVDRYKQKKAAGAKRLVKPKKPFLPFKLNY